MSNATLSRSARTLPLRTALPGLIFPLLLVILLAVPAADHRKSPPRLCVSVAAVATREGNLTRGHLRLEHDYLAHLPVNAGRGGRRREDGADGGALTE